MHVNALVIATQRHEQKFLSTAIDVFSSEALVAVTLTAHARQGLNIHFYMYLFKPRTFGLVET